MADLDPVDDEPVPRERKKVHLKPGRSPLDWSRLVNSGQDLTGGFQRSKVSKEELQKHCTRTDAWIAIRGKVYNVTHFLEFHPGGEDELMRGAGRDATLLFDKYHRWVNADAFLEKCYIGFLVP